MLKKKREKIERKRVLARIRKQKQRENDKKIGKEEPKSTVRVQKHRINRTEQKIQDREADAKRKRKKRSQHKGEDDNRRKKMALGKRLKRISNTNVQHAITLLPKFQGK